MTGTSVDVTDLLERLWLRRQFLLVCGIIGAVIAFAGISFFPPRYASEGLLLVEGREAQIPGLTTPQLAESIRSTRDTTPADILHSRSLLEEVVRTLGLTNNNALGVGPRLPGWLSSEVATIKLGMVRILASAGISLTKEIDPARQSDADVEELVEYLQKRIKVEIPEKSRTVSIRFVSSSPQLAAGVINTLMNRYIADDLTQKRELIQQVNRNLSESVTKLRHDVDEADRLAQEFRRTNNVLHVQAGSLQTMELNTEEARLSSARAELARLQFSLDAMQGNGGPLASQEALASPVIQSLRHREAELYQRLDLRSQKLGSAANDTASIQELIRSIHNRMDAEARSIVEAVTRNVAVARARVSDQEVKVARLRAKAEDSAAAEATLAGLERDAEAKRQTYNSFLTQADQTRFASSQLPSARVVSPAILPARAEPSFLPVLIFFGFLGGTSFGAAGTLLRGRLNIKIRTMADLASVSGMTVLGSLPVIRDGMAAAVLTDGQSLTAETLRAIRVNILEAAVPGIATSILVTSTEAGEGKTTIAAALSRRLAADGIKVLLIEADLRRPSLRAMLNLSGTCNIEGVTSGQYALEDSIDVDQKSGLHCLLSSGRAADPMGLLVSDRFTDLIAQARKKYEIVVLDSPPILRVADPVLLARVSDLTLFVVRSNHTDRALVSEAIRRIPEKRRSRIIMALNRVQKSQYDPRDYYSGYRSNVKSVDAEKLLAGS